MTAPLPSLARQLVLQLTGLYAFVLLLAIAGYLVIAWDGERIRADDQRALLARALQTDLVRGAAGRLVLHPGPLLDATLAANPHLRLAILDPATGALADGSTPSLAQQVDWRAMKDMAGASFILTAPDGSRERGRLVGLDTAVGPVKLLWVGAEQHGPDIAGWVVHELTHDLLPILVSLFAGTLLIGPIAIRRGLAPLRLLSDQARRIEPRASDVRLAETGVPREILPLVRAVNSALDRLEDGFLQQRRFTATIAHELRTPLAIMQAKIEALPPRDDLVGLERSIARMAHLIGQLLAAARLEARQLALDERVDLAELARQVLADFAPLAIAEGRDLALVGDPPAVWVTGNSAALQDALRNLVENAVRVSPAGDSVDVAVGPGAAIEVRDRGPGVPAADRAHIFEPFRRAAGGGRDGIGLGLAIVAQTMALHGGRATVEDRPGGGSVFRLTLPQAAAPLSGRSLGGRAQRSPAGVQDEQDGGHQQQADAGDERAAIAKAGVD